MVLAGYPKPTLAMVELNPGLASRIGRVVAFPRLSADDLLQVFVVMADEHGVFIKADVKSAVASSVEAIAENPEGGAARGVRNLLDRALERHAARCAREDLDPLREPLRACDIAPVAPLVAWQEEFWPGGYL